MQVELRNLENGDKITLPSPLNLDFWVDGNRRITLSISEHGTSVQIPSGSVRVSQRTGSFYASHKPTSGS